MTRYPVPVGLYGQTIQSIVRLMVECGTLGIPAREQQAVPQPKAVSVPPDQPGRASARPGCVAGDESGLVLHHLEELASGKQGFGVLRVDRERLERAALGADQMGDPDLARQFRAFSPRLEAVRDPSAARDAAGELHPLADQAWELARKCGGHSQELMQKAQELSRRVQAGKITRAKAVASLRESL